MAREPAPYARLRPRGSQEGENDEGGYSEAEGFARHDLLLSGGRPDAWPPWPRGGLLRFQLLIVRPKSYT